MEVDNYVCLGSLCVGHQVTVTLTCRSCLFVSFRELPDTWNAGAGVLAK